ncbi:hypothetical protein M0802_007713 [Mischocyttarus mexicanus]|nr:hypothetical protein M0802_007713 [Mischocyttarus mexicanus]
METFQLYYMKQAFAPVEKRFTHLRKEALKLKYLWSYDKKPNKCRIKRELKTWYKEAINCVENNELLEASKLITKMLLHNPKSYKIYNLRGTVFKLQGKLNDAIKNYEMARLMLKLNQFSDNTKTDITCNESLIECYETRGNCFYSNGFYFHAARDYERIVILKPYERSIIDIEKMYELVRTMAMHSIVWCMYRNYDKSLYTIQKVCNYDPSNLQYILLKIIILRLSGRTKEALSCLGKIKDFIEMNKKKNVYSFEITDSTSPPPLFNTKEIKQQIKKQYLLAR